VSTWPLYLSFRPDDADRRHAKEAPVACLPDEPSLEQLRHQAKDLRRAVLAGEPGALAEVAEHFPDVPRPFALHAAQLVVARRYEFPSWARPKRHVEVIEQYSRFPDRMTAGPPAARAAGALGPPAIEAFAGQDIDQAVFYPEDDRYLIERDLTVRHYEVAAPEQPV
jgi:hypothetical protein